MQIADLALQRSKYKHLTDEEWRWFLQQEEGRQRTADKLPTFAAIQDWWYPVRLSCEQCSSELTARYKGEWANGGWANGKCLDLTGGYGVDTFFLSQHFAHTDYVEQDAELCRIAEHNFALANKSIVVHNASAESFLEYAGQYDLIFMDPARRDSHGGKVFRLQDCTPNMIELLPTLLQHLAPDGRIMLKLSPMLDITQAIKELSGISYQISDICWDAHVVAVKNEVKEVVLLSRQTSAVSIQPSAITCIDLTHPDRAFTFTREEEQEASSLSFQGKIEGAYLFEPNAAILKAGAYKLIATRFELQKLDTNTHLYITDTLVANFPGRIWQIRQTIKDRKDLPAGLEQANIICRNYPLTTDQLRNKLHLRDGGTSYVIGCRIAGHPTLFLAERV